MKKKNKSKKKESPKISKVVVIDVEIYSDERRILELPLSFCTFNPNPYGVGPFRPHHSNIVYPRKNYYTKICWFFLTFPTLVLYT